MQRIVIALVSVAVLAPAALADGPAPTATQFRNAAKLCKALRARPEADQMTALAGKTFAQAYGTRANAHGKCVSAQAKARADAVANAAHTCKGWSKATVDAQKAALAGKTFAEAFGTGANAHGKCVSAQSK